MSEARGADGLRKFIMLPAAALAALLALGALVGAAGCGQPDLSRVNIDNPVLDEAWAVYAEAEAAGVNGILLERVKQDLAAEEQHLKQHYLDTGDMRSENIEPIIAGLTAEMQVYIDDLNHDSVGMTPTGQEEMFAAIRETLLPNLGPGEYVYAIAVSAADPTWALAWVDQNPRDFTVEGPAFALRQNQGTWTINYAGHDASAFPGLPPGLADSRNAYTWLSDTAWVVTQTESYAEAARPGQPYRLERFDFDSTGAFAYVYLKFASDTMSFRYQKALRMGWALIETYIYPPEAAQAAGGQ
jgi:hypothetical protein